MLKRAIPFALLAACTTESLSTTGQDIIGGQTAQTADYPSVVGLEETPGNWFCTGTLIDSQWVLTAAHCMDGETATKIHVRFGSNNIETATTGTVVGVAEIHSHPGFDFNAWDNDIALIKLAAPVTNVTPSPILRDALAVGSQVLEVGYGVADNNDGGGGILRQVTKTTADCAGANDPGISGANLICMNAGDGKGSCYGDSGGPAFAMVNSQRVVAGVTSGGSGDSCGAGWDLYTSVKAEIDFVETTMGATTPPSDPMDPGMGSGSNTDTGTGSGDNHDAAGGDEGGGCNAGGSAGSFVLLALMGIVRRKREAKPAE
jgi:secreted trypsin-like serine protease